MNTFKIRDEYIHLNQLIKAAGWVENGAQANSLIEDGMIRVNGVVELRKRNKLYPGMKVEFQGNSIIIE